MPEGVIVVAEGASAAGKTTWARRHAGRGLVPESAPSGEAPDRASDAEGWTRYWHGENEKRWLRALQLEAEHGLVICDTDPLKAHYAWCMWQAGLTGRAEWDLQRELCAVAFERGRLGFADLVLFADLTEVELRARKAADASRQRRRFELHVRLAEPLRRWYAAIDRFEPGRVIWQLPEEGLSADMVRLACRDERSGSSVFARFLSELDMLTERRL